MIIRPYEVSDKNACIEIFKSNIPRFFLAEEIAGYEDFLDKMALGAYWVLLSHGKVIACGGIGSRGNEGRLHFGIVANRYHRQGFGSKLLKYRLAKLIENPQILAISLDTSQHNPGFFQRFGFVQTSKKENAYGNGLHRHDMRWLLPENNDKRERLRKELLDEF